MKGSEKQVAWAMSKISVLKNKNDARLANAQRRYDDDLRDGVADPSRLACVRDIHNAIASGLETLENIGNASQIIDYGVNVARFIDRSLLEAHGEWVKTHFANASEFVKWAAGI
jgi:phage baseplate assembly protein W